MRTIYKKILGIFFIILGLIGLVLPVLQGVLFLILGFTLLGYKKVGERIKKFFSARSN